MARPRILFAHERRGVARAVTRVLLRAGFEIDVVTHGDVCHQALLERRWDGLVVDVGLPGIPSYELVAQAKSSGPQAGAEVVVLVASVYRKTSYKRRPSRLYGADDYVEIHHLCDSLPAKLRQHLRLPELGPGEELEEQARQALRDEGDTRLGQQPDADRLASLIVADMILYNGDALHAASTMAEATQAVGPDLDIARELFRQVLRSEGRSPMDGDPVGEAFGQLMGALGRAEGGPDSDRPAKEGPP